MQITVLTENTAGKNLLAEHGLSYFIEHNGVCVLFDTGHSDVFMRNANKLGIDVQKQTDTIVLSHGHWDHGDGLQYLSQKPLITHPEAFKKRYRHNGSINIGLGLSKDELEEKFKLTATDKPWEIGKQIIYLGEIPRVNGFETRTTPFVDEKGYEDFVPDDSALAIINHENELVIISGCAHAGICNIINYAMEITGIKKVKAVLGGFHLKTNNEKTKKTIQFLKDIQVKTVLPSHCTELPALAAFHTAFKSEQVKTGNIYTF